LKASKSITKTSKKKPKPTRRGFDPRASLDQPNQKPKIKNMKITTHTNSDGTPYYSTTDENGQTIYSFTKDFEDIWTQEDQDAIESGSTPSKI
jgi:hypothetical protein